MGKGKKEKNPADAFRKEQRKAELKKLKKDRQVVREVNTLLNDPSKVDAEIERVQKLSDENKIDKSLKERLKELRMMKNVAVKKQLVLAATGRKPLNTPVESSSSSSRGAAEAPVRRPEESAYFHPQFNPTGMPPPGQPMLFRPNSSNVSSSNANHSAPPRPMGVGGLNGIPLPPPRPVALPFMVPLNNTPFNMMQTPRPPPPGIGFPLMPNQFTMHGIPPMMSSIPPPPRVPPSAASQKVVIDEKRRERVLKRNIPSVDPLDPSAEGYTARFQANARPKENLNAGVTSTIISSIENGSSCLPNSTTSSVNISVQDKEEELMQKFFIPGYDDAGESSAQFDNDEYNENNEINDEKPDDLGDNYDLDNNDEVPTHQETALQFRMMESTQPLLTAEELMKRRFQVQQDKDDDIGIPGASFPAFSAEMQVPQPLLTAEELMRRRYEIPDDSEDDPNQDDTIDAAGPSLPRSSYNQPLPTVEDLIESSKLTSSNLQSVCTATVVAPAGLAALGDYSDSDEDGDSDYASDVDKASEQSQGGALATNAETKFLKSTPAVACEVTAVSSTANFANPVKVQPKVLPKVVKADSALTAFLPNSLRNKRKPATSSDDTTAKMQKTTSCKDLPEAKTVEESNYQPVDDIYNKFLEEINSLAE